MRAQVAESRWVGAIFELPAKAVTLVGGAGEQAGPMSSLAYLPLGQVLPIKLSDGHSDSISLGF